MGMSRLERIEKDKQLHEILEGTTWLNDIEWLIQQVNLYKECQADAIALHKERNRYKQALEFYAKALYHELIEDKGKKARQALDNTND